jgi:hypothetical protein
MIAALKIFAGLWSAGSLIVLAILLADYIAGAREGRWIWAVTIALGPVALIWELYLFITDRDE